MHAQTFQGKHIPKPPHFCMPVFCHYHHLPTPLKSPLNLHRANFGLFSKLNCQLQSDKSYIANILHSQKLSWPHAGKVNSHWVFGCLFLPQCRQNFTFILHANVLCYQHIIKIALSSCPAFVTYSKPARKAGWEMGTTLHSNLRYRIVGNFREVQIFAIFTTHDQNAKIRTTNKLKHVNIFVNIWSRGNFRMCVLCAVVLLNLTMALYHYPKPADDVILSLTGDLSSSVSLATIKGHGQ